MRSGQGAWVTRLRVLNLIGGSALFLTKRYLKDIASPIQFEAAAIEQQFFQLAPGPLHARFCAGGRQANALSHFLLGYASPLREQQGFAVRGLQLIHELTDAGAQVGQVGRGFGS
jgi:hypothetical protein